MPQTAPSRKDAAIDEERAAKNGFSGVDAVERALTLLHAFDSPDGSALTLKALAERSGLTKSTILRLAVSLERFGYLVRDREGLYHLGPTLWRLGSLFRQRLDIGDVVRPVLEVLVTKTSESASFYVPRGDKGVCLYRVNSPRLARDHVDEGDVIPFGLGSSGQILKAFSGSKTPAAAQIRRERIYVSHGERDPDVAGVSAPVLDPSGELIGAISLSGLANRFTEKKLASYRLLVSAAARDIEARIGVTAS